MEERSTLIFTYFALLVFVMLIARLVRMAQHGMFSGVRYASHFRRRHGRRRLGRVHDDHLGLRGRLDDVPFGGSTARQPTRERDHGQSRGQTNNFEREQGLDDITKRFARPARVVVRVAEIRDVREYGDINKGADERYRRERYLRVRDAFARISSAATGPGGDARPDERAHRPNRRQMPSD